MLLLPSERSHCIQRVTKQYVSAVNHYGSSSGADLGCIMNLIRYECIVMEIDVKNFISVGETEVGRKKMCLTRLDYREGQGKINTCKTCPPLVA